VDEDKDFVVSLSEDDAGNEVWAACCRVCGGCFPYLTWPDETVIQRLEDHVHQDPDLQSLLRMGGRPGNCDDNLLRAIGVPEEML